MKLFTPNIPLSEFKKRLRVNSGAELVLEKGENSFYPKQDWNVISDNIISKSMGSPADYICVFSLPQYVKELFWDKIMPLLFEVTPDVRVKVLRNYTNEVIKRVEEMGFFKLRRLYSYELVFNKPNHLSTAYDHKAQRQVGLHIDTHNIKCLWQRRRGFQLMSFNLGDHERYFYFINLEVNQMVKKLISIGVSSSELQSVKDIKDIFLLKFPNYPVYRIRIEPGEAYIGISQNFIHDGGTNMVGEKDITLLIGGFLEWHNQIIQN